METTKSCQVCSLPVLCVQPCDYCLSGNIKQVIRKNEGEWTNPNEVPEDECLCETCFGLASKIQKLEFLLSEAVSELRARFSILKDNRFEEDFSYEEVDMMDETFGIDLPNSHFEGSSVFDEMTVSVGSEESKSTVVCDEYFQGPSDVADDKVPQLKIKMKPELEDCNNQGTNAVDKNLHSLSEPAKCQADSKKPGTHAVVGDKQDSEVAIVDQQDSEMTGDGSHDACVDKEQQNIRIKVLETHRNTVQNPIESLVPFKPGITIELPPAKTETDGANAKVMKDHESSEGRKVKKPTRLMKDYVTEETGDQAEEMPLNEDMIDKPKTALRCLPCGVEFKFPSRFKAHLLSHNEVKPFECEICNKRFRVKHGLEGHMKLHSDQRTEFICAICGLKLQSSYLLKKHNREEHESAEKLECKVCERIFSCPQTLKNHESAHLGRFDFCCEVCGRGFSTHYGLRVHQNSHTKERPFSCKTCSRTYTNTGALHNHKVRAHGLKPTQRTEAHSKKPKPICNRPPPAKTRKTLNVRKTPHTVILKDQDYEVTEGSAIYADDERFDGAQADGVQYFFSDDSEFIENVEI